MAKCAKCGGPKLTEKPCPKCGARANDGAFTKGGRHG